MFGQGAQEILTIAFGEDAIVQNNDSTPVVGGADQSATALAKFQDSLGQRVMHKAIFTHRLH